MVSFYVYRTILGDVQILEESKAVVGISFHRIYSKNLINQETSIIKEAFKQLSEYFEGIRQDFDLPLNPKGTDFQKKIWCELTKIPYGETKSYKQIAESVGTPKACRAVGAANNKNPISIVIPCHRVIGSNGNLVGYGGGLHRKEFLLNLEQSASKQKILQKQ